VQPRGAFWSGLKRRKGITVGFPGHELRQRRLELNMSTETVAAACAIPVSMIDALEGGMVDRLPGDTYAVGFIRSYCRLLGLESEHYLDALRCAQHPFSTTARNPRPSFLARLLHKLPIPRVPRVSSEVHMWILIMVFMGAAWAGYSVLFRPQAPADANQIQAAEIDLRLPESIASEK
jgi:cytoskeletal protein RodZ